MERLIPPIGYTAVVITVVFSARVSYVSRRTFGIPSSGVRNYFVVRPEFRRQWEINYLAQVTIARVACTGVWVEEWYGERENVTYTRCVSNRR